MANAQKIRIRLKAYDHELIDQSAEKIIETAKRNGAKVSGPIPLPTEKQIVTILRAVHKYKDSREQFERRTHKRLIDIINPNQATIDDEEKNPIGQYTFTYNGGTYTLRAAKDTGDISGVWENGTTLGNGREGDVTAITTENGGLWSRWFDGDMQYSLYAEGAAMDDYTAVRNAMA